MVSSTTREKSDLFRFSLFAFLFKNSRFLLALRLFVLALFIVAVGYGFVSPDRAQYHFTYSLFWSLFWPFFMVVSLPTFGSLFCGICPHGFLGKYLQKHSLNLTLPKLLQSPLIGLFLLLGIYWSLTYFFPTILETPLFISLFFLFFTILAVISFLLFKNMSYCKSLCPIGSVTAVFSKVAFVELGTNSEDCASCKGYECAKACPYHLSPFNFEKQKSMQECKLCMECVLACEAVNLKIVSPAKGAISVDKKSRLSDVWTIALIIWVTSFSMLYYNALGHSAIYEHLPWVVASEVLKNSFSLPLLFNSVGFFATIFSLLTVLVFIFLPYVFAGRVAQKSFNEMFLIAGYSLAPLVLIGGSAQTVAFFFTTYFSDFINSIIMPFGFEAISPLLDKKSIIVKLFSMLHFVAVILSFYVLKKRIFRTIETKKWSTFWIASTPILFYLCLVVFVIVAFAVFGVRT